MQLEQLLQDLGIAEHMKVLSDWRDDLIREKATELQAVRLELTAEKEEALAALSATHRTEVEALNQQLQGLP